MKNNFAETLKELRLGNQTQQKDLAILLGVSTRQYQRYEKGDQEPNIDGLLTLAEFFGVSLNYLVGKVERTNPSNVIAFAEQQKIEVFSDPDTKEMVAVICRMMSDSDPDIRAWTKVQFRRTFAEYYESLKKEKKEHA